jgi:hypothetical protein
MAQSRPAFCVVCAGPEKVYRCEVETADVAAPAHRSLGIYCVTRLAKDGGHDSCAVGRGGLEACAGETRVIAFEGTVPQPGSTIASPDAAKTEPAQQQQSGPPSTVVEATQRAVAASGQGLKKAGETVTGATKATGETVKTAAEKTGQAVGGAAKSAWRCLTSLFSDCK